MRQPLEAVFKDGRWGGTVIHGIFSFLVTGPSCKQPLNQLGTMDILRWVAHQACLYSLWWSSLWTPLPWSSLHCSSLLSKFHEVLFLIVLKIIYLSFKRVSLLSIFVNVIVKYSIKNNYPFLFRSHIIVHDWFLFSKSKAEGGSKKSISSP